MRVIHDYRVDVFDLSLFDGDDLTRRRQSTLAVPASSTVERIIVTLVARDAEHLEVRPVVVRSVPIEVGSLQTILRAVVFTLLAVIGSLRCPRHELPVPTVDEPEVLLTVSTIDRTGTLTLSCGRSVLVLLVPMDLVPTIDDKVIAHGKLVNTT